MRSVQSGAATQATLPVCRHALFQWTKRQSVSAKKAYTANAATLERRPIGVPKTLPKHSTQLSDRAGMLPLGKPPSRRLSGLGTNEKQAGIRIEPAPGCGGISAGVRHTACQAKARP